MSNKPTAKPFQEDLFLHTEGDAWFSRNEHRLGSRAAVPELDQLADWLDPLVPAGAAMLEIGCSNGSKLDYLSRRLHLRGHGVEPSTAAVTAGQALFPNLVLKVGSASALPFPTSNFAYVHFGFCMYLLPRESVLIACAEADRVLAAGGLLSILDFHPHVPHRTKYAHSPGAYSYKQRYYEIFTATSVYSLVGFYSLSHFDQTFHTDQRERLGVALLHKETAETLVEISLESR